MISVCMATYNGCRFIREQIDSILTQLSIDDELIISDDGSTDGTLDIIASYSDNRIRLFHHNKVKQKYIFSYTTANIKNALKQVRGDIIFLADQDDVWLPNKVKIMLEYCQDYDLVLADCFEVDKDLNTICKSHFSLYNAKIGFWHNFRGPCCYLGANMCFKRSTMSIFMDIPDEVPHDLWIGTMVNFYGRMYLLQKQTLLYRRHDANVSGLNNRILGTMPDYKIGDIRRNNHSLCFKIQYRIVYLYNIVKRILFGI